MPPTTLKSTPFLIFDKILNFEEIEALHSLNKNLANQVRKNLREYLCVLFGYSHSESPIEQESKNIYRVAFSISFSTGHVDEANSRYVAYF